VSEVFSAVPAGMGVFSAIHHAAGAAHHAAGSADSKAMVAAAAAALGPIGATFLAAYAPAQANCLAATMLVGHVHHAIGHATEASTAAIVAADNA
jgi:hypothetical protein